MTTIEKAVTVREDHSVHVELSLPNSVPAGTADMVVMISPRKKKQPRTSLKQLAGSLANSKNLAGDSVALVRQWRDEW